ncbi:Ig-like domain-containing protein [Lysobacter korlensis]|uniref:Ig-like domain-containing protein n=1 Tax=Lysobacter korlensis TaxID=553636 RepID=A0ABV6RJD7_9GAMM
MAPGLMRAERLAADSATVAAGDTVVIDVLANDQTLEGDRVLLRVLQPATGTARIVGNTVAYTAPDGVMSTVDFYYQAKSRRGGSPRYGKVTVAIGQRIAVLGRVVRSQQAPTQVELRVGERTYTTTTAHDGSYRVQGLGFADHEVAVVEARGAEAGSSLRLQSYLGTFGRLRQSAGTDQVLERAESNAVTVSFLSSAQMAHAVAAYGDVPDSDDAYEAALLSADITSTLQLADFLDTVDAGRYPLPAGVDALTYASAPGRVRREWNPPDTMVGIDFPRPALKAEQTVPPAAGSFDRAQVLLWDDIGSTSRDGIRSVELIEPTADGKVNFIDGYAREAAPLSPMPDEHGRATFIPSGQYLLSETTVRTRDASIRQLRYLTSRKLIKLFEGRHGDQYFQQDTIALVHPDRPTLDRVTRRFTTWVGYEQLPVAPYSAAEVAGRATFAMYCLRPDLQTGFGYCDYPVHSFDASGSGRIEALGPSLDGSGTPAQRVPGGSFEWRRNEAGAIVLRQGPVTTQYVRVTRENEHASGVISRGVAEVNGVTKYVAHYQQSVRLQTPTTELPLLSAGSAWSPGLAWTAPLSLFDPWTVRFSFADGRGEERSSDGSGYTNILRFAWANDSEGALLKQYEGGFYYEGDALVVSESDCALVSADGQCPVTFRRWTVLASMHDRQYLVEEEYASARYPAQPLTRRTVRPLTLYRN